MVHCGPCPWCFTKCGPKEVKEILVDSIAGKSFSLQVYPYRSNGAFLPPRASPLYRSTTPTLFLKTLLSCRVPIHSINFFFYLRCYLQIIYSKHTKTMPKMVETWTQNTFLNAQPQVLSGKTLKYICNIISLKQTKFVGSQSSYSRCWSYRDQKLTLDRKGTRKKKQKNTGTWLIEKETHGVTYNEEQQQTFSLPHSPRSHKPRVFPMLRPFKGY